ncbi:TPA: hypothetical protein U5E37_004187 [Yersinia enterocolitica]|uniref:hypothetical protein n=1 Tax=Yersinia enterocolitica TaxID=630 RepID=UPI00061C03FB|nr:hypothetical protein [Yersinia enterocolitica]CNB56498.1 Uncharacterised protein [Yersinia enterocolitica]HEN3656158.1 hypothetical protein [Yersinia enterocolitica]
MKEKLFFNTSRKAANRLTEIFDFAWPTTIALWNLRWQVEGYVKVKPDVNQSELTSRFISGSSITGSTVRADLKKACIETSWEKQQNEFSKILLIEFCSLYEIWCEGIITELKASIDSKSLQFPTLQISTQGIMSVLSSMTQHHSIMMEKAFYSFYLTNKKNSKNHINNLMKCYRYFKELRNSLVHSGNISKKSFKDAEANYSSLTATSLGVQELPEYKQNSDEDRINLSLRGVIGFGEIVLRMISTIDAELVKTTMAEKYLAEEWKKFYGDKPLTLSITEKKRNQQLVKSLKKLGLSTVPSSSYNDIELFMRSEKLIF